MPLPDKYPIDQYLMPSRRLGVAEEDWDAMLMVLCHRCSMYLRGVLYIYPIKTILNICYKLLYAKIGVLDLYC